MNKGSVVMRELVSELESVRDLQIHELNGAVIVGDGVTRVLRYKHVIGHDGNRYLFETDDAGDDLVFELRFVRVGASNEFTLEKVIPDPAGGSPRVVQLLDRIRCRVDGSAAEALDDADGPIDPLFTLTNEQSKLTIHFRLRREIGHDSAGQPIFTEVEFRRAVNLRNNNL